MPTRRIALAVLLLLLIPRWSGADPAEEQAIKQADKPAPVVQTFHGCPARGHGGDEDLNFLKNRVDVPDSYLQVSFATVRGLKAPIPTHRKDRANWREVDTVFVKELEGAAVTVIGYLAGVRLEGPESTNCGETAANRRDFHIWLVGARAQRMPNSQLYDRTRAVVVEVSPRLREQHNEWTTTALGRLVGTSTQVRISGWLMLDQEHPEQINKTRGTLWEIHPIMRIEVREATGWRELQ
jgi:hypothetical protein